MPCGCEKPPSSQMASVSNCISCMGCQPQRQQYQPNANAGYPGFTPRYQNILGHSSSPACKRVKAEPLIGQEDIGSERKRLFSKDLEALDWWQFCNKAPPCPNAYRPISYSPVPDCGCPGGNSSGAAVTRSAQVLSLCGSPGTFNILSPGRSVCDYAQRRLWGAGNESTMTTTCGDILPKLNSHRRTDLSPLDRIEQIFRHNDGMIPNYLGSVPGERFRFGMTFNAATRNPHRAIEPLVHKPLCYPVRT